MIAKTINEQELHAYADGRLEAARREAVEAWLHDHPEMRQAVAEWRIQNERLHHAFDPVMNEAVPVRLAAAAAGPVSLVPLRLAAAVVCLAVGGVVGYALRGETMPSPPATASLPRQAAIAHAVFSPEVRHPVEVGAAEEAHLVAWLSKRLGAELKPPHLSAQGFELVGGRLLPGEAGPVAQFMYQDARGQRLTLYVRRDTQDSRETAFRYARENGVGVFYWLDGRFGYALSGEMEKPDLLRIATAVYQQLNP
ncbi:MAG: anti-sigma factor [Betaproteobacteria bacterium]|nr:anti-sigma factor [Betaproteobacteria bacterium]